MTLRPEFTALMKEDKDSFKNELNSLIQNKLTEKVSELYMKECELLFEKTKTLPKKKEEKQEIHESVEVVYMPISEINNAINSNRTNWITAKDGSQLEVTPQMAKYLAELYKTLNNSHKDKLVNLILESDHGFKKAVKTAEKLYRR
jgi:hypothetical protein